MTADGTDDTALVQLAKLAWMLSVMEIGRQEKAGRQWEEGVNLCLCTAEQRPYHTCKYLFSSSLAFSLQEHPLYGNAKNAFSIINPSLALIARILNNWVTTKILKIPLKQCLQELGVAFCCHGDISRDRSEFWHVSLILMINHLAIWEQLVWNRRLAIIFWVSTVSMTNL